MLQIKNLKFSYGSKPLYEGVSFVVGKSQKVGLVGPNGSGKSTLLSIIMGKEDGYTGDVRKQGIVALVPQEIKNDETMDSSTSVREYVDPDKVYEDFEVTKMLKNLELDISLSTDPKSLSGGQKTKLALARALLQKPDLLLLDEPTNFMDTAGKNWVMQFLSKYEGAVIVISHDLQLMDSAIDKILAITPYNSKITEYKGNYSTYQKLVKDIERNLKRELIIKKQHLERTKAHYQMLSKYDSKKAVLRRQIAREVENLPEIPPELKTIKVKLPEPRKVGEIPIKAKAISKSYGDLEVLSDVNISIVRNERVALIGPNGAGKSTFIKILMEMLKPDQGEVIKDENLKIGYYSQEFETFDFDRSVIDTFCEKTNANEGFARSFLGRFLFTSGEVFQSVRGLSGGEKTRLSIAIIMATDNNLLILDEPTTYLDVMSQRIILEALKLYQGTMLFVSHTPEFVKELEPTKAILFPDQKLVFWKDELLDKVNEV